MLRAQHSSSSSPSSFSPFIFFLFLSSSRPPSTRTERERERERERFFVRESWPRCWPLIPRSVFSPPPLPHNNHTPPVAVKRHHHLYNFLFFFVLFYLMITIWFNQIISFNLIKNRLGDFGGHLNTNRDFVVIFCDEKRYSRRLTFLRILISV